MLYPNSYLSCYVFWLCCLFYISNVSYIMIIKIIIHNIYRIRSIIARIYQIHVNKSCYRSYDRKIKAISSRKLQMPIMDSKLNDSFHVQLSRIISKYTTYNRKYISYIYIFKIFRFKFTICVKYIYTELCYICRIWVMTKKGTIFCFFV